MKNRNALIMLFLALVFVGNDLLVYAAVKATERNVIAAQHQVELRQIVREHKGFARVIRLLAQQSAGECYRVNYARWLTDRSNYARWRTSSKLASDLRKSVKQEHSPPLTRVQIRETRALADSFTAEADATKFAPLTDCRAALANPGTYHPPLAKSFKSLNARDRDELANPPLTPQQGRY